MTRLDAIWDQPFPSEQQRIVRLLVERVVVSPSDIEVRLRQTGIEELTLRAAPVGVAGGCRMSLTRIKKTGETEVIPASDGRLTISVPLQIKRRSGRKLVTTPRRWPLQLALARGHRWLALLESGEVKSLREVCPEGGGEQLRRMVNLTTVAPDIITCHCLEIKS